MCGSRIFVRLYGEPNYKLKHFSCWDQFLCMAFAQLTYRESLRDIEACLHSAGTKHFILPAATIAQLYRSRWQVELFFKWIKQHLRIKAFYGTTENALKTQIWIAISIYVLVVIVKKRLNLKGSLYRILQILSVTMFEKTPLLQAFSDVDLKDPELESCKQLNLFE